MDIKIVFCLIFVSICLLEFGACERDRRSFTPQCPRFTGFNGRPVKYRRRGSMAVFKCRKKAQLYGEKRINCLSDGTWSAKVPVCIKSGCNPVDLSHSEYLDMAERFGGALLSFSCEAGYQLLGATEVYCDGDNWNKPMPTCAATMDLTECDFEKDLCGWTQDDTDQGDWVRNAGATPTGNTGPMFDHTYMDKGTGHYMFFETSNPTINNDQARLVSPEYMAEMSPMCFDFWYHILGPDDYGHVGSLEVYILGRSEYLDDLQPVFYKEGNQGNVWHRGEIPIDGQVEPYQIVIVATKKLGYVSDIAIDDLRLFNCTDDSTSSSSTAVTTKAFTNFKTSMSISNTSTSTTRPMSKISPKITTPSYTNKTTNKTANTTVISTRRSSFNTTVITQSTRLPQSSTTKVPKTTMDITTRMNTTSTFNVSSKKTVTMPSRPSTMTKTDSTATNTTPQRAVTTSATEMTSTKGTKRQTTPSPKPTIPTTKPTLPHTRRTTPSPPTTPQTTPTTTPTTTQTPSTPSPTMTTTFVITTKKPKIPSPSKTKKPIRKTSTRSSTLEQTSTKSIPTKLVKSSPRAKITTEASTHYTGKLSTNTRKTPKQSFVTKSIPGNETNSNSSSDTTPNANVAVQKASEHPADETLKPLMIGLGVGIVVGLIIIGVIAYVCVRRRKFYTSRYEDELKPITTAESTHSINNVQYYHDQVEEYDN